MLQIQFTHRLSEHSVVHRDGYSQCKLCRKSSNSTGQFLERLFTRPLLCHDRCLLVRTVLKAVEVLQCSLCLRWSFRWVFSHFSPSERSAEVARSPSARVRAHSSSSELSAHQMPACDDLWVQISTDDDRTYWHTSRLGDVSRWPLRVHRPTERADVHRAHALICTGATARPGRDRNTGSRSWPWWWLPLL